MMQLRSIAWFLLSSSVIALTSTACTTTTDSTDDEDEAVGMTADGLVSGSPGTGNVTITPDELKDPTTGCFVLNPICDLSSGASSSAMREIAILSSNDCLRRAPELSHWCGNRQGVQTTALFKVRNVVLRSATFTAPNDTRCVISLGVCQRYPNLRGVFGDTFEGSDTNPARCAVRAKEFHAWCANPPLAKVAARFDRGGVLGPVTFYP